MSESNKKSQKAKRYRKARADASIGSIQQTIEKEYGLPSGSVKLVKPNGKKIRADATVGTLSKKWK